MEAGQRPRGCPRLPPARPTQTHAAVKPFPASWAPSDLGAQFQPHSRQQCPGVGSQSLGCPAPPDRQTPCGLAGWGWGGQAGADSGAISQHRETMSQKGHLLSEVRGDFLEAGDAS